MALPSRLFFLQCVMQKEMNYGSHPLALHTFDLPVGGHGKIFFRVFVLNVLSKHTIALLTIGKNMMLCTEMVMDCGKAEEMPETKSG